MFPKDTIFYGKSPADTFRIISGPLTGGFAGIYEALDRNYHSFAIKTIQSKEDLEKESIVNEGLCLELVQCHNVIKLHYFHDGVCYSDLPPYLILEYAEGKLLTEIDKRIVYFGQFSMKDLMNIFLQLSCGMLTISGREVVHNDINPSNILLVGNSTFKIADFGVSERMGQPIHNPRLRHYRRWDYVAPEFSRADPSTIEMDIYSMGLVFYEIATLKYPYIISKQGDAETAYRQAHNSQIPETPIELNPHLSEHLNSIIMRMIDKKPQNRFHSWQEILVELQMENNRISNS